MPSGTGHYSRIVAILKVGLPLIAVGLLASLFLGQPGEPERGEGLAFSPGDVAALGTGLRISSPTFTGTTRSGDRFRFTADLVVPDAAPPERAAITGLAGSLELAGGPTVHLEARSGDLHIPTQRLDLIRDVAIETPDGYRITAEAMTLELRSGSMIASGAVRSTGPLGQIDSGTLRVAPAAEKGEARRFSFGEGVRLVYDPPDPE